MAPTTPRCVYCAKPTRSHRLAIHPAVYARALRDRTIDDDFGAYEAFVCHACWTARELDGVPGFDVPPDGDLPEAMTGAIRSMRHVHVRFDLPED